MANQELLIQRGEIEAQAGLFDGPDVVLMVFAEPAHRAAQVFTMEYLRLAIDANPSIGALTF